MATMNDIVFVYSLHNKYFQPDNEIKADDLMVILEELDFDYILLVQSIQEYLKINKLKNDK